MKLNGIKPAAGSKTSRRRVGRGIGSGLGKTAGRGHKGQKSRAGGYHKTGFEGGQMPLQRRLPKRGFKSALLRLNAEVTLRDLESLSVTVVSREVLVDAGMVRQDARVVKLIKCGSLHRSVHLSGIKATDGAKQAVELAGGSVS